MPRRAPCRIVDDHTLVGEPRHYDEVVAARAILDQDDDGSSPVQLFAEQIHGTREPVRLPAATGHCVHERLFGDSARALVGERRKLLDVGASLTPVTKKHGHGRAAAHRLGLSPKGHIELDAGCRFRLELNCSMQTGTPRVAALARSNEATSDGKSTRQPAEVWPNLATTMIRITARRMMMTLVVESVTEDEPPTSASLTCRAALAAPSRSGPLSVPIDAITWSRSIPTPGQVADLWPIERFANGRAIGILAGDM